MSPVLVSVLHDIFQIVVFLYDQKIKLITDEKREYERALRHHDQMKRLLIEKQVLHMRVNSKEPRTKRNPLFPVNYLDRQLRKEISNI